MTPLTPSQLSALEPLLREAIDAENAFPALRRVQAWLTAVGMASICHLALHLIEENRRLREAAGK